MSIGRGGPKRPWKKRGGLPVRPLRWISGATETADPTVSQCVFTQTPVFCHPSEGDTALEIVQGKSDLTFADRQVSTVTRVVGQLSFAYSQIFTSSAPSFQIPYIRAALVTVDSDVNEGTWVPPDLWNRADLQEVSFMWMRQGSFSQNTYPMYRFLTVDPGGPEDSIIESRMDWDVDCTINRQIGRDGSLFLLFQSHFSGPVSVNLDAPLVGLCQNLRVLMKI